jgi:hypothetical protein
MSALRKQEELQCFALAHHDGNEWVLESLIVHLRVHVDTAQPAPVPWM